MVSAARASVGMEGSFMAPKKAAGRSSVTTLVKNFYQLSRNAFIKVVFLPHGQDDMVEFCNVGRVGQLLLQSE